MTPAVDYGWPSIRLTIGAETELILTPDIGGRLMGIRLGGEELLFVNPALEGRVLSEAERAAPAAVGFPLWGGEKTWIAPQSTWPHNVPMPDLDSGPYAVEMTRVGTITMTSPVCRQTGLQIERTITTDATGWTTRHTIRNRGKDTHFAGPWTVMMILRDTHYFIPAPRPATTVMFGDIDHLISETGRLTTVRCTDTTQFKTGHPLSEGWFAAFVPLPSGRVAMIAQFCATTPDPGRWAHGHVAEVYNADRYPYSEMELHGGAVDLAPGGETSWLQRTVVLTVPALPATEAEVRQRVLADT